MKTTPDTQPPSCAKKLVNSSCLTNVNLEDTITWGIRAVEENVHDRKSTQAELYIPQCPIDEILPVVCIATKAPNDPSSSLKYEKTLSNIQEVTTRSGRVIAIAIAI